MEFSLFWTLRTTILWARTTSLRLWRWMQIFSQSLPMQGSPSKAGDMRLISSCMTSCRLNEAWSVHCIHCPKLCDIYTISSLYGWLSVQMPRMSSQLFVHVCLSSSTECDTVRFDDLFHDHCTIYAIAIVKYHAVCVCYTVKLTRHLWNLTQKCSVVYCCSWIDKMPPSIVPPRECLTEHYVNWAGLV